MTGLANNYGALCYHLKLVKGGLNNPKKSKIDFFLDAIRHDLLDSNSRLSDVIEARFPLILNLRVAALKSLLSEGKDFNDLDIEVYPYFEQMTEIDRLSNLSENILFALRSNKKVLGSFINNLEIEDISSGSFNNLPEEMSYDQFINSFYLILPTAETANLMIEWTKCSFRIEYIICAAAMIFDEKLMVPSQKINELSAIIVEAAQTYSAIAMEIGILPLRKTTTQPTDLVEKSAFLEEQKNLAETGLFLFAKNWNN